jgi:transposase-like protein
VRELAQDLQISDQTIYNWGRQDFIDSGQLPGITSTDHAELVAARRRIAELETDPVPRAESATGQRPAEPVEQPDGA